MAPAQTSSLLVGQQAQGAEADRQAPGDAGIGSSLPPAPGPRVMLVAFYDKSKNNLDAREVDRRALRRSSFLRSAAILRFERARMVPLPRGTGDPAGQMARTAVPASARSLQHH